MYKERFGKNFTILLDEKGWSSKQASNIFSVSTTMIEKYKQSENFPEAEMLGMMADVFGVSVDWLMGRSKSRVLIDPC